jgi:hypothetical protein
VKIRTDEELRAAREKADFVRRELAECGEKWPTNCLGCLRLEAQWESLTRKLAGLEAAIAAYEGAK